MAEASSYWNGICGYWKWVLYTDVDVEIMNPPERKRKKRQTLRMELILMLSSFVSAWKSRPDFGKGSNRSDLVVNFEKKLLRKYKLIRRKP